MSYQRTQPTIDTCVKRLKNGYIDLYGDRQSEYIILISVIARLVLSKIAQTDAPYHDLEHTVLVTLAGLEILRGKQLSEKTVTRKDWLNTIISLLCHDIGYRKGICRSDRREQGYYTTGDLRRMISLSSETTDASLAPYHIERGKLFVEETFNNVDPIDIPSIQHNIELTRFPVPPGKKYQDTESYAGLVRAADLIGQFADSRYLTKMTGLFREFEEIGAHQRLGYRNCQDLRKAYPHFFYNVAFSYIQDALKYLHRTDRGKEIIIALDRNLKMVERFFLPHPRHK